MKNTFGFIPNEMRHELSGWRAIARKYGISNSEIEQMKQAFRLI